MADQRSTFQIGKLPDGTFAAVSTMEPVFCLVGNTEQEAVDKGNRAFRFFHSGEGTRLPGPVSREQRMITFVADRSVEALLEAA